MHALQRCDTVLHHLHHQARHHIRPFARCQGLHLHRGGRRVYCSSSGSLPLPSVYSTGDVGTSNANAPSTSGKSSGDSRNGVGTAPHQNGSGNGKSTGTLHEARVYSTETSSASEQGGEAPPLASLQRAHSEQQQQQQQQPSASSAAEAARRQEEGVQVQAATTTSSPPGGNAGLVAAARGSAASVAPQPFHAPARRRFPNLTAPTTWTLMLTYIIFMLLMPITALLSKAAAIPPHIFIARATEPVAMHAYYVTFSMALVAAAVNCVFGFVLAWCLTKFDFPGRKWFDAAVDLPFALPTSVAGLTMATVYGDEGPIGRFLQEALGLQVVYTRLGVAVAMIFVSFPFVVRTMQPVMLEMEKELEEAAWSLGASPWRTFTDVVFPPLLPSLLTGTALAFSRALGEFGSIVIISSNFAFKDLIAPVLIFQCLEQYDYVGATVIGTVLLMCSLIIMLFVNQLQQLSQRFKK